MQSTEGNIQQKGLSGDMGYVHSEFVKAIAEELIEKHPDLITVKEASPVIAYLESDKGKSHNGGIVHADCEKVKPKMKEFVAYDYIITAYMPNCAELTENQWKILIFHELLHVDCDRDLDGVLTCRIRPHDIEDFHQVTDRFGTYWSQDQSVGDILEGM